MVKSITNKKTIKDYLETIEIIAKMEYARLGKSAHLIDYADLVNIGAIAVHLLIKKSKSDEDFNKAYLSTAIRWAIRNELRQRYKWYANKHYNTGFAKEFNSINYNKTRHAVYETILSIEGMQDAERPSLVRDKAFNPEEKVVFCELSHEIKESIKKLPKREQMIITKRFIEGVKVKDLAQDLNITSSRISKIVQTALNRLRKDLKEKELIE